MIRFVRDLEARFDPSLEYGQPSLTQTRDGRIHISYTWSGDDRTRLCIRHVSLPNEQWIRLGAWTYTKERAGAGTAWGVNLQVRHGGTLGLATQGEYRGRSIGSNKHDDEVRRQRFANKERKRLACWDRIGQFANACDEDTPEVGQQPPPPLLWALAQAWARALEVPPPPQMPLQGGGECLRADPHQLAALLPALVQVLAWQPPRLAQQPAEDTAAAVVADGPEKVGAATATRCLRRRSYLSPHQQHSQC